MYSKHQKGEGIMDKIAQYQKWANEIIKKLGKEDYYVDLGHAKYKSEWRFCFDDLEIEKLSKNDIYIKYNGIPVFYSKKRIINSGPWEDLLLELYKSIDVIEKEQKDQKELQKKGYLFISEIAHIFPKPDCGVNKHVSFFDTSLAEKNISNLGIKLYTSEGQCLNIDGRGIRGIDKYYTYEIYVHDPNKHQDVCVFKGSLKNYSLEYKIYKFIPGPWQEELLKYAYIEKIKKDQERAKTIDDSIQESIGKLQRKRL